MVHLVIAIPSGSLSQLHCAFTKWLASISLHKYKTQACSCKLHSYSFSFWNMSLNYMKNRFHSSSLTPLHERMPVRMYIGRSSVSVKPPNIDYCEKDKLEEWVQMSGVCMMGRWSQLTKANRLPFVKDHMDVSWVSLLQNTKLALAKAKLKIMSCLRRWSIHFPDTTTFLYIFEK